MAEPFPVDRYIRAARHLADLSQRELAERAGVERHAVARAESRPELTRVHVFANLLDAVGWELVIAGPYGFALEPELLDQRRDQAGRRYPAHLDVRDGNVEWWGTGWVWTGFFQDFPRYTFDRNRALRDWHRRFGFSPPSRVLGRDGRGGKPGSPRSE